MTITPNSDGSLSGFVRLSATKGAVFDAATLPEAMRAGVEIVAHHCTETGESPCDIIAMVEFK